MKTVGYALAGILLAIGIGCGEPSAEVAAINAEADEHIASIEAQYEAEVERIKENTVTDAARKRALDDAKDRRDARIEDIREEAARDAAEAEATAEAVAKRAEEAAEATAQAAIASPTPTPTPTEYCLASGSPRKQALEVIERVVIYAAGNARNADFQTLSQYYKDLLYESGLAFMQTELELGQQSHPSEFLSNALARTSEEGIRKVIAEGIRNEVIAVDAEWLGDVEYRLGSPLVDAISTAGDKVVVDGLVVEEVWPVPVHRWYVEEPGIHYYRLTHDYPLEYADSIVARATVNATLAIDTERTFDRSGNYYAGTECKAVVEESTVTWADAWEFVDVDNN